MFIKSIVLDGFKSYGNRVEVTGFDPEFNAITGLNGTGKSNILDSICFVLGITNLSNVRASNLQELIYKHGQAGIIKATVSITFDNRDKKQCPIGYENHDEITVTRQVVMGGKNKYMINGINVQNKRVSDLFCSVQLNVNNPHFLIMQGRITKVLNMKPQEILSMVEEAAGTRMYEAKKQAAQKTIEKKDAKLRELNDIIREDIAPKLQKLQDERSQFQEYQKVVRELENLTRLYVAWKYVTAEERAKEAAGKVTEVENEIQSKKEDIKINEKEVKDLDKQVAELSKKLDEESGAVLKELEKELQSIEETEATLGAEHRAARDATVSHQRQIKRLERSLADDVAALQEKKADFDKISTTYEGYREASKASAAALTAAQERFVAVSTGLEDESGTLQDKLMEAKQEASEASTVITQCVMQMNRLKGTLERLEEEFESSRAQYEEDQETIASHEAMVDDLTAQLASSTYSEEYGVELQKRMQDMELVVRDKRDAVGLHGTRLPRCNFYYTPPEPNFDKSRVSGPVCRLIKVCDSKYNMALETAAGGRLFNVIVDTDVTSKLLLEHGDLYMRTTMIPLNKITSHVIKRETVRLAQEIGGGPDNVQLALDLVSFEERLRPAMEWVFGGSLVCSDMETAKRVTFDPRVSCRCVTLEGDVFDPSGTLSGGAPIKTGSILVRLDALKVEEAELQALQDKLEGYKDEIASLKGAADNHFSLKQRLDLATHALGVAKKRVATTTSALLITEIKENKDRLTELKELVALHQRIFSEKDAIARDLQEKVKDIKGHRERTFKKAEEALKKAKEDAARHCGQWEQREQEYETLRLEVAGLEASVAGSNAQLQETKEAADELQRALEAAKEEHEKATGAATQLQTRIKKQKAEIASRNGNINKLTQRKEQLRKKNMDLQLNIKQLEYDVAELRTEAAGFEQKIKSLETENTWIATEKQFFGAAGGLYDFQARQASVAGQRLSQLKERKDRLARGLNARAHTLLGKEEEQYQDVMRKKKIVEADRAKLVQVMAELDEKKRRTLVTACDRVNQDFGSIFSTLLPGAQAQLSPPPGLTVLDGLEVKVGFNNTWKESLGELSGGQRSLVALSLVLAMLLFKPAPLYILDEVDAALDLSHTQNIGRMLKEHFKHSQFIIVSLKDGMFNNANVLFRTRFVDGMSSVQRTVNAKR